MRPDSTMAVIPGDASLSDVSVPGEWAHCLGEMLQLSGRFRKCARCDLGVAGSPLALHSGQEPSPALAVASTYAPASLEAGRGGGLLLSMKYSRVALGSAQASLTPCLSCHAMQTRTQPCNK
jgi:hypothetical protein